MATASNPLTSSSDLWVLPQPAESHWFSRIDWYLNWQLCKGLAHERQLPHAELFRVMEENGIPFVDVPVTKQAPLMVLSQGRIPAAKCIVIENSKTLKTWLGRVHQLVQGLHIKSARVFLPKGANSSQAADVWRSLEKLDMEVEFSPDEESLND